MQAEDPAAVQGLLMGLAGVWNHWGFSSGRQNDQPCILDGLLCWLCKGRIYDKQERAEPTVSVASRQERLALALAMGRVGTFQRCARQASDGLDTEDRLPCFWLEWQRGAGSSVENTTGRVDLGKYIYTYTFSHLKSEVLVGDGDTVP